MNILSIGEVLWDVFGDAEHLGGAALNFAAHARVLGIPYPSLARSATTRGDGACSRKCNPLASRLVSSVR